MSPGPKKWLERRPCDSLQFCTKKQVLKINIDKVTVIRVTKCPLVAPLPCTCTAVEQAAAAGLQQYIGQPLQPVGHQRRPRPARRAAAGGRVCLPPGQVLGRLGAPVLSPPCDERGVQGQVVHPPHGRRLLRVRLGASPGRVCH